MRAKVFSQAASSPELTTYRLRASPCQGKPGSRVIGLSVKIYDVKLGKARIDAEFFD